MILKCKDGHGPLAPSLSMSGDHIKASCFICGCYIKFVAYKDLDSDDLENLKKWQEEQTETISEYKRGFLDALECFAWWRDGVQYVGQGFMTLKEAKKDVLKLFYYRE